nr:SdiA-regulated domain-containing protein [Atopomonas sediminilitoris]
MLGSWGAVRAGELPWLTHSWFSLNTWWQGSSPVGTGVWLNDYQVVLDGVALPDVEGLSDVQYDPQRQQLWALIDRPAQLLRLSLQGEVLQRIELNGMGDAEALTLAGEHRLVVADERLQRLYSLDIDQLPASLDVADLPQLTLGLGRNGNKGFEGLGWDESQQRLWVAKERDPKQLFYVQGFPDMAAGNVAIEGDAERDRRLFVRDLSGLHVDSLSGNLLLLSDESQLLVEVDQAGRPQSSLSLRRGQAGLSQSIPQAEGVSMDTAGNLYVISEPNLLYVFARQGR